MTDVHSKEAQRANVFLLWKTGKRSAEIADLLLTTHGEKAMTLRTVQRWLESFKAGRTDLTDEKRTGRPRSPSRSRLTQDVKSLLEEDARLTVRELSDRVDKPPTNVFRAIKEDLGLVRLSARWVPRLLTQDMKDGRVNFCRTNLERVDKEGGWEQLRALIVTGDETWVPYFDPPTKQETMVSKSLLIVTLADFCSLKSHSIAGLGKKRNKSPPPPQSQTRPALSKSNAHALLRLLWTAEDRVFG